MTNRITILNELKESSPVLALQDPFRTPYQVPQGYFESLPGLLLDLVKQNVSVSTLPVTSTPFDVPQGYFENFADSMLSKVRALESGSASEEIAALSPLLQKLNRNNLYSVPEGYFEELPENITDGAKAIELVNEELENLSPMMSSLKGKNVYTVPSDYFERLPETILERASTGKSAKVISISFTRKITRYAAAAAVAGLIFLGGWQLLNTKPMSEMGSVASNEKVIPSTVSDTEILKYLENDNATETETAVVPATSEELNPDEMKEMLADISDEELQKYAEQANGASTSLNN